MPKKALPWEYCECGCHGHQLSFGDIQLWSYNNLHGKLSLYVGHSSYGLLLGEFKTLAAETRAARKYLREQLAEARETLDALEAIL